MKNCNSESPTLEDLKYFAGCIAGKYDFSSRVGDLLKRFHLFRRYSLHFQNTAQEVSSLKFINSKIVAQNMSVAVFLKRLDSKLREYNIQIVLLKSSAFYGSLYDVTKSRCGVDIDLLVSDCNLNQLEYVISEFGYVKQMNYGGNPFDGFYEDCWLHRNSNFPILDIHRKLVNPLFYQIDNETLFQSSKIHPHFNSNFIKILSEELNFIHLCIHIAKDGYLVHHSLIDAIQIWEKGVKVDKLFIEAKQLECVELVNFIVNVITNENISLRYKVKYETVKKIMEKRYDKGTIKRRIQQIMISLFLNDDKTQLVKYIFTYISKKINLYIDKSQNS